MYLLVPQTLKQVWFAREVTCLGGGPYMPAQSLLALPTSSRHNLPHLLTSTRWVVDTITETTLELSSEVRGAKLLSRELLWSSARPTLVGVV